MLILLCRYWGTNCDFAVEINPTSESQELSLSTHATVFFEGYAAGRVRCCRENYVWCIIDTEFKVDKLVLGLFVAELPRCS